MFDHAQIDLVVSLMAGDGADSILLLVENYQLVDVEKGKNITVAHQKSIR